MFQLSFWVGVSVIAMACLAEYVDSTLGMGYGTSLTPILLMLGFEPIQVVPAILLAELFTGLLSGIMHTKVGNANFKIETLNPVKVKNGLKKYGFVEAFKKGTSLHLKIALLIATFSIIGSIIGVNLAIKLPALYLKMYIGILVFAIGIYIIFTYNKKFDFTWTKLSLIAIIASFNKGISGGGYGPVVTGGQLLAGVDGKNAVAITSLAEGLTCMVGTLMYCYTIDTIDWMLAPYLILGGILAVPLSAITVKRINMDKMKVFIGFATIFLGAFTISRIFL